MQSEVFFCESQRRVPMLSRGWRTPDPSPTRDAAFLPRCVPSELCTGDGAIASPRGGKMITLLSRGRHEEGRLPETPRYGTDAARGISGTRTPSPLQLSVKQARAVPDTWTPTSSQPSSIEQLQEITSVIQSQTECGRMAFCELERGVPKLQRGWRTPDPSPTRDAAGLPRCAPSELYIGDEPDGIPDSSGVPAAWRGRGASREVPDSPETPRYGTGQARTGSNVRTPSPPQLSLCQAPPHALKKWRTTDPSPTPGASGLSRCAPADLYVGDESDAIPEESRRIPFEVQDLPETPRYGMGQARAGSNARTPSPPQLSFSDGNIAYALPTCPRSLNMFPAFSAVPAHVMPSTKCVDKGVGPHLMSAGSAGHPYACAEPCKYWFKRGRCKDGDACDHCHLCDWTPNYGRKKANPIEERMCTPPSSSPTCNGACAPPRGPSAVAGGTMPASIEGSIDYPRPRCPHGNAMINVNCEGKDFGADIASIGSIGHPSRCAAPCKFWAKRRACKDGAACDHCHICEWKVAKSIPSNKNGSAKVSAQQNKTGAHGALRRGGPTNSTPSSSASDILRSSSSVKRP